MVDIYLYLLLLLEHSENRIKSFNVLPSIKVLSLSTRSFLCRRAIVRAAQTTAMNAGSPGAVNLDSFFPLEAYIYLHCYSDRVTLIYAELFIMHAVVAHLPRATRENQRPQTARARAFYFE